MFLFFQKFEPNKKSTSFFTVRTVLIAIIGFMPQTGSDTTGIGSLTLSTEQRQKLAKKSLTYSCDVCGAHNATALPEMVEENSSIQEDVKKALQDIAIEKVIDEKADPNSPAKESKVEREVKEKEDEEKGKEEKEDQVSQVLVADPPSAQVNLVGEVDELEREFALLTPSLKKKEESSSSSFLSIDLSIGVIVLAIVAILVKKFCL